MDTKVLVFDSGKGGEYVATEARKRFPGVIFDFVADSDGIPYGNKTPEEIIQSASRVLEPLISKYDVVIIACHTLTEVGVDLLRKRFAEATFVGFDPGIKKAKDLGCENVCVLATRASLASDRYQEIRASCSFARIVEPDCSSWAERIEDGTFDPTTIISTCMRSKANCFVLACTHYFWYEQLLRENFPDKIIINPTQAVLDQLERLLTAARN